jgi:hypothetical protein
MAQFIQVTVDGHNEFVNADSVKRVIRHQTRAGKTTLVFNDGDSLEIDMPADTFVSYGTTR